MGVDWRERMGGAWRQTSVIMGICVLCGGHNPAPVHILFVKYDLLPNVSCIRNNDCHRRLTFYCWTSCSCSGIRANDYFQGYKSHRCRTGALLLIREEMHLSLTTAANLQSCSGYSGQYLPSYGSAICRCNLKDPGWGWLPYPSRTKTTASHWRRLPGQSASDIQYSSTPQVSTCAPG